MTTNGTNATPIPNLNEAAQQPVTDPVLAQVQRVAELGARIPALLGSVLDAFDEFVYETSILFQQAQAGRIPTQEPTNANQPTNGTDQATTA